MDAELDHEHFRSLWSDIFWLNSEYLALLSRAKRSQLKLVMLSNTNALHIEWARRQFPEVFEIFDHEVFSFGLHTAKPDRRIFQEALRLAEVEADEAIYFDDIASYADAASAMGIHGHQFVSVQGAQEVLELHELINPAHQ
jgi:putative hydrolase of the HAD superfamily